MRLWDSQESATSSGAKRADFTHLTVLLGRGSVPLESANTGSDHDEEGRDNKIFNVLLRGVVEDRKDLPIGGEVESDGLLNCVSLCSQCTVIR